MSTTESTIEKKLREWLESQGYPLEMQVSIAFQRKGFNIVQSEYYSDPESNVAREVDVVAHLQRTIHNIHVRVTFVIECKVSRDKPWVLFTSHKSRMAARARIVQRAASNLGWHLLLELEDRTDVQNHAIFQIGDRPGHGLTQAFTSGQDITYAAATGVAKASLATKIEADEATKLQFPACEIIFPVIVIDGRLFECYLEDNAKIELSEIATGILNWRNPIVGMPHTIIHLVTLPALDSFVSDALGCADLLLTSCDTELQKLAAAQKLNERGKTKRKSNGKTAAN